MTVKYALWSARRALLKLCRIRRHRLAMRPLDSVEPLGPGRFEAVSDNPLIALDSAQDVLPGGWVEVVLDVLDGDTMLRPVLITVDQKPGQSLAEAKRTEFHLPPVRGGRISRIVRFPDRSTSLQLRPLHQTGTFGLGACTATEIGTIQIVLKALRRDPAQVWRILCELRRFGAATAKARIMRVLMPEAVDDYRNWAALYGTVTQSDRLAMEGHIGRMARRPLISVVMPVFNPQPDHLKAAIESVRGQLYPHWELCIADDASTDPEIARLLDASAQTPGVHVVRRPRNGHISAASNSALSLVSGEFVAFLDHDDLLAPDALYMVAAELEVSPDADILYSDEDKIGPDGERFQPTFKPDWDPERLLGQNYLNHLSVFRTSLVRAVGGFREGFDGSQDHDLALRVSARTQSARIRHIPFVLYHWRIGPGDRTFSSSAMGQRQADTAALHAVRDFLEAAGEAAIVSPGPQPGLHRIVRLVPDPAPHVSLIVPTRDGLSFLRPCLDGLLTRTDYPALDVIVIDNGSEDPATLAYLAELTAADPRLSVLKMPGPFNFSALNNRAVGAARGPYIGFINNDIEVIGADWLSHLMSQAIRPGVGAVGAKLLYASGIVQHAGIVLGIGGVAGHIEKHADRSAPGYVGQLLLARAASAVTAACMIVAKEKFQAVGGFDEAGLAVAFNDVDLCIRLQQAGHTNIWTPLAELFHKESVSRGTDLKGEKAQRFGREIALMQARWGDLLQHDPYYSANLGLVTEDIHPAFPPRTVRPWRRVEAAASGNPLCGPSRISAETGPDRKETADHPAPEWR